MTAETRLVELGLHLPSVSRPKGLYRPLVIVDRLAYTSGHLPTRPDGSVVTGCVGADLDQAAGAAAARLAALAILATLRAELGSLDRVRRVVKMLGLVHCTPEFQQHPAVINGASELFAEVFGQEDGVGARSALGAASLPLGAPVEIEAVFELHAPVPRGQSV